MPVRAQYILEVGNSQCRVNLKQSRHQSLRFLITSSQRTACGGDSWRDCTNHTCRHLVLHLKDILDRTFEAIGPKMCT